jgi:phage terminase small subunit
MKTGRPRVNVEKQQAKHRLSGKQKAAASPKPVKLGGPVIRMPVEVKADGAARAKWAELKRLFAGKDFISSSDIGVMARYCLLCSEEITMKKKLDTLAEKGGELKEFLGVNRALDTKRALIRSLEDRLYLNPIAKMRGLPPEEKPKVTTPLERAGFGEV